jgi:hypothetical protein
LLIPYFIKNSAAKTIIRTSSTVRIGTPGMDRKLMLVFRNKSYSKNNKKAFLKFLKLYRIIMNAIN